MQNRIAAYILILLCCGAWPSVNLGGGVPVTGGAGGTNFLADADCIGAYLYTDAGTEAGHEVNRCTQVVNPAPDVVRQGTGATTWAETPPSGSPTGYDAVDWDTGDYMLGEGSSGEFDMISTTTLTVACWYNPNEVSTNNLSIFSRNDTSNWELFQKFDDVRFEVSDTSQADSDTANPVLSIGSWTHIAGVYDDTDTGIETKLYVNGSLADTAAKSAAPNVNNIDVGIGASHNGGTQIDGKMYECVMFDRVLSATEIAELFLCGAAGDADGTTRDSTFGGATCGDITTCC